MYDWYESKCTPTLGTDIDILTLGCSKNLVDTERLMAQLEALGFVCHHDPEQATAPIAVINTCGFIGDAKEESINTILQFAARKTDPDTPYPLQKLYVMGCLSERYRAELEAEIPEVDAYYGKFDYEGLADELGELTRLPKESMCYRKPRVITTPSHYAYLKISEGCNRFCSYCAIPLITGRHTSRPMDQILDEVRWLSQQGVKEVNVIAQDLSSYGLDLYKEHKLPELIDRMAGIEGIRWIRLHYAYPADFPEALLDVMAKHANVCKYIDLAVQHCTDHMLQVMRRHLTAQEQDELLAHIRERVPGIVIRTTVMVGHPGETEEDFEALLEWIKKQRFERLGAFAYSDEEGTYAHKHYKDTIPDEIKQNRLAKVMATQQLISAQWTEAQVGKKMLVIIDRQEGDYFIGRTQYDSPEVDCEILVERQKTKDKRLQIGQMYEVEITRAEEFDLYGHLTT